MSFTFFPRLGPASYKDNTTGRFVAEADVIAQVEANIALTQAELSAAVDQLYDRQIGIGQFVANVRKLLRRLYGAVASVGAGGLGLMNPTRWGSLGGLLRSQYRFLSSFAADLVRGRYTIAQRAIVKNRLQMYAQSARNTFYNEKTRTIKEYHRNKQIEKRKIVNPLAENCPDCQDEAGFGWVHIDDPRVSNPGSGRTQCLTNCKCSLKYRIL